MKKSLLLPASILLGIILGAANARAQLGSFNDVPIEITSDGEFRFVGGVAVAENNVVIHYGTTSIYADYVQYNPDTRDVMAIGNIRVYRDGRLIEGDRGLYNLETKLLRTNDFRTGTYPFLIKGETVNSLLGSNGYVATNSAVTTSDSSKPDYHVTASKAYIYPGDHVTLANVTAYVGETPVFWFPFFYQSLKEESGFSFIPGYGNDYGAYLLTRYGFPISDSTHGALEFDVRSKRGLAGGLETVSHYGEENKSWSKFRSYYAHDTDTEVNNTAETILPVSADRYRVSYDTRTYLTNDLYATATFTKLSDYRFLKDFYPSEYHNNPQPDNVLSLTKWDERYTISGVWRLHVNKFFDTTERLEGVVNITRQPILSLPGDTSLFYESDTSGGRYARRYGTLSNTDASNPVPTSTLLQDYSANRFTTGHLLSLPQTYFGWLSVVPRVGVRASYYSSGASSTLINYDQVSGLDLRDSAQTLLQKQSDGSVFQPVIHAGVETSFKFSRDWEDIQSRTFGLDGLRHVVQPYNNFSFVRTGQDSNKILQFDRLNPSTELASLDFTQFTATDALTNWTIWRWGVRNFIQTRRDDQTINLLELDSFFNINLESADYPGLIKEGSFSNFCNRLTYNPVNWVSLTMDTQVPMVASGFTQINTDVHFLVSQDLSFTVGHRYLENNPYFDNSSNLRFGSYYRINDNWAVSFLDQYEFSDSTLQRQDYEIHRDLSSWIVTLALTIKESRNSTTNEIARDTIVSLAFTLKDLPSLRLPISGHPTGD
ncbi:MAG: LPS-assembly protein LptD [Chthoniobacteraceae bacterium]